VGEIFARPVATKPLAWTGERLTTTAPIQVEIEHLHRYCLARELCRHRHVLDISSGEGYGTALLAQTALAATGVEISYEAVAHAAQAYRSPNLRFCQGDARSIPVGDASVDVVVSFETIEHFYEHDMFLAEVRRVLRPGGMFIVSSPDRDVYSPPESAANPFHRRELSKREFHELLKHQFAHVHVLGQRPVAGSAMIADTNPSDGSLTFEKRGSLHLEVTKGLPRSIYVVAIASDSPVTGIADSIYVETSEVGKVLASASAAEVAAAQRETAYAEIASARASAAAAVQERDLARSEIAAAHAAAQERDLARSEIAAAHAAAASACQQLDLARIAARRAAAAAEGHWRGKLAEIVAAQAVAAQERDLARSEIVAAQAAAAAAEGHWRGKLAEVEHQLAHLSEQARRADQYDRVLSKLGVRRAARLIPLSGRRFLADRLFGSGRQ
jgi:SAM-dependent methyltransferase